MNTYLVVTATGPDSPGVAERITEQILNSNGNVEASRMARLGGEFAAILLVSVADTSAPALVEDLKKLEHEEGYTVSTRETQAHQPDRYAGYVPYEIRVEGADHPGIIHRFARHLASQGVNIESMEATVKQAPMSGGALSSMIALVVAPSSLSRAQLQDGLEQLGLDLGVLTQLSSFSD